MRNARHVIVCVVGAFLLRGCVAYRAPVKPPQGILWTEFRAPLMFPKAGTTVADLDGCKRHTKHICLPVFRPSLSGTWQGMALAAAVEEAGFDEVLYADYRLMSVLGVYAELELNLYGR